MAARDDARRRRRTTAGDEAMATMRRRLGKATRSNGTDGRSFLDHPWPHGQWPRAAAAPLFWTARGRTGSGREPRPLQRPSPPRVPAVGRPPSALRFHPSARPAPHSCPFVSFVGRQSTVQRPAATCRVLRPPAALGLALLAQALRVGVFRGQSDTSVHPPAHRRRW